MAIVVYAALALPALRRHPGAALRPSRAVVPAALACSLIFFAATNFAVWAFSGMYSLDTGRAGRSATSLALPFLKYTIAGDLFWSAALFGGAWLVQRLGSGAALSPGAAQPQPADASARASDPELVGERARHRLRLGELQADRDDAVVGHRVRDSFTGPSGIDVVGARRMLDEIGGEIIRQRLCRRPPAGSSGRRFPRARRASHRPARRNPRPARASGEACGGRSAKKRSSACTRSGGARK